MIKSMYVHIPFCDKICSYCDFPKLYTNRNMINNYLKILKEEIKEVYQDDILETIYIGGGTPSALTISELERLFKILDNLKKNSNLEYTIEANFDSLTKEKLDLFKKYGINRISFGIETINKKHLKFLNRDLNISKVKELIEYSKKIGITNINVDLMYGLKDETIEELKQDLDFLISLDVNHISTYSLILEEHTKLYIDKVENISEDLDYEMYKTIIKTLEENNFKQYEISNFSKLGYESKHNLRYWNNEEYYGVGLGAASYIGSKRITNTRSFSKYLKKDFILDIEELSEEDKCIYEMILGLRKCEGVSKDKFYRTYHCTISEKFDIIDLLDKRLLEENDKYIFIPRDKLYVENEILLSFVGGSNGKD